MNKKELYSFFSYCEKISDSRNYAAYTESDPIWTGQREALYANGIIPGLYREKDEKLFSLISQPCDHKELIRLLNIEVKEYNNSELTRLAQKYGTFRVLSEVREPLLKWVADYNYLLAFPMYGSKEEMLASSAPERVLSYVYVYLAYNLYRKENEMKNCYLGEQPNTEALYKNVFDKSSEFRSWGLLPVDEIRKFDSQNDPVRLYDSSLDKTIFLNMPRPLAGVLDELYKKHYIGNFAIRSCDFYIYDGVNCMGSLLEALEKGSIFSWNLEKLPDVTRLYSAEYEDCLWIKVEGSDITFEELCKDFHEDGEFVVTQMIHLQHVGNTITHLDHEYIFYDLENYDERIYNVGVKGEGRKRVKTFKIDRSTIPMDYQCKMYKDDKEVLVPFIFFVLNNYFEHKELLEEYFHDILRI